METNLTAAATYEDVLALLHLRDWNELIDNYHQIEYTQRNPLFYELKELYRKVIPDERHWRGHIFGYEHLYTSDTVPNYLRALLWGIENQKHWWEYPQLEEVSHPDFYLPLDPDCDY